MWIAQLVEQWTEDPRVTSSNLVSGIKIYNNPIDNNNFNLYTCRLNYNTFILHNNHLVKYFFIRN
jgi:hypothetical protein